MFDDKNLDEHVSLNQAAKELPSGGPSGVHVSTIVRWSTRGIGGVKLETTRFGGRRYTTRGALLRFFEALNTDEHAAEADGPETSQDVSGELDAEGL